MRAVSQTYSECQEVPVEKEWVEFGRLPSTTVHTCNVRYTLEYMYRTSRSSGSLDSTATVPRLLINVGARRQALGVRRLIEISMPPPKHIGTAQDAVRRLRLDNSAQKVWPAACCMTLMIDDRGQKCLKPTWKVEVGRAINHLLSACQLVSCVMFEL